MVEKDWGREPEVVRVERCWIVDVSSGRGSGERGVE